MMPHSIKRRGFQINEAMKRICIFFVFAFAFNDAIGQIKLPRLVRDSMVLQRDARVKIWGWASPGEKIKLSFIGKKYKATAAKNGKWEIMMSSLNTGGPYTMELEGKNKIQLKDVLVGDIWICSGQSNMVHQMELHSVRYAEDIAQANYPQIRHFFIPTLTDITGPREDLPTGYWKSATPTDVRQFSAVAYFFAKSIYDDYHIPIGLINASVGGTPIEAWTSEEGLKDFPALLSTIQKNKDTAYVNDLTRRAQNRAPRPRQQDKGLIASPTWYDPAYVPKGWHTINIPGYWEDQGIRNLDGVVWYRKEIDIPASMTNMPARVFLGRIVDADFLYINGVSVGNTTYQYPQRRYTVAPGVLKAGKNIFVVRVINNFGKGGFVPDKPYYVEAAGQSMDLKGYWQYKVGDVFVPQEGGGGGIAFQNQPAALYNAMVAPLINYTIKGFLWYQGEANTGRAADYAKLQPAMIADWRNKWNNPNAPFLYVQLPGFMDISYLPSESQWAALRESQLKSLSVPNTGMAVAIDLGEWNDIHPDNKKDVGIRLALAAQKIAYGRRDIVYSGPIYQSATIEGDKINISFSNTGSGLATSDGEVVNQFAIAGADKKFVWANAKIEGNRVVVWNENIKQPMYVRYAWADNPDGANLINKEGLPASPFRTDN
jgi:sialate O-acetylesterase